jgi:hypothetical protein
MSINVRLPLYKVFANFQQNLDLLVRYLRRLIPHMERVNLVMWVPILFGALPGCVVVHPWYFMKYQKNNADLTIGLSRCQWWTQHQHYLFWQNKMSFELLLHWWFWGNLIFNNNNNNDKIPFLPFQPSNQIAPMVRTQTISSAAGWHP